jgi:UMF1 family MFS transporter
MSSTPVPVHRYSKHEQRGWYFYDWGNSAFSTTVVTLFLGPYLTSLAKTAAGESGSIHPLGIAIDPRAYWGYLVSLSVILQAVLMPIIGALADYGRRKKELLALCAYTGASATVGMYFLDSDDYLLGGALFLVANVAFGSSLVVYNSFLPEIAAPEDRDAVSSKGWGLGYLGGGLLLALNLLLYTRAESIGLTEARAVRISLASAGLWWGIFTIPTLAALRNRPSLNQLRRGQHLLTVGFFQLFQTLAGLKNYPKTLVFLVAYTFYNDAIQTVISLASQFGSEELKIPLGQLTLAILMVQFVAFFGALAFNWIASRITAKRAVMLSLVIWIGVVASMYLFVRTVAEFFVMAAIVAIVLGGSQALSRALFSLMIPPGKEAEYFALYEISDKGTSWLCPMIFSLALDYTGSYRLSILSLLIFFVAGLAILSRVQVEAAAEEARSVAVAH